MDSILVINGFHSCDVHRQIICHYVNPPTHNSMTGTAEANRYYIPFTFANWFGM